MYQSLKTGSEFNLRSKDAVRHVETVKKIRWPRLRYVSPVLEKETT